MNILQKAAIGLSLAASFAAPAHADVTQSMSHSGTDQYAWVNPGILDLGGVTLASGTKGIYALTSLSTLVDQGWGYTDPSNGVFIGLFQGSTNVYSFLAAGSSHEWATQSFNIADNNAVFYGLNAALSGLTENSATPLSLRMYTDAWGYPGWELHTRDNSFSVTSGVTPVPEPETYAMLLAGLGLTAMFARRRKNAAAAQK